MTYKTFKSATFESYLKCGYDAESERVENRVKRKALMETFPFGAMLELAVAEMDFANRWCWETFGPCDGTCQQEHSQYRVCDQSDDHVHEGSWTNIWYVKTGYDFGFNEWYFTNRNQLDEFLAFVPSINWGQNYPK